MVTTDSIRFKNKLTAGACTGMRGAKRAGAQAAARDVYRRTARRLAAELRAAGMVLESNDGWER